MKFSSDCAPCACVGCEFNQYSDMEMYMATATPIIDATHVELLNVRHVAMHRPMYVT